MDPPDLRANGTSQLVVMQIKNVDTAKSPEALMYRSSQLIVLQHQYAQCPSLTNSPVYGATKPAHQTQDT